MYRNVGQLKTMILELLGDPTGSEYSAARVLVFLNLALDELNQYVAESSQPWALTKVADAISISWAAGQRELGLSLATYPIDQPFALYRVDDGTAPPLPFDFVPIAERETYVPRPTRAGGVSVYRRSGPIVAGGVAPPTNLTGLELVLAMTEFNPPAMTLRLDYWPLFAPLTDDAQYPVSLPASFANLLALKAAIIGKHTDNRDVGGLERLYNEALPLAIKAAGRSQHQSAVGSGDWR